MGKRKSKGKQNDTPQEHASGMQAINVSNEESEPTKNNSWHNEVVLSEERGDEQFSNKYLDSGEFSKPKLKKSIDRNGSDAKNSHPYGFRHSEPSRKNQYEERTSKRQSLNNDGPRRTDNSSSQRSFKSRNPNQDPEFLEYEREWRRYTEGMDYTKVKEITMDLFEMPEEYCLAHCVAEDMNMGSGIAVPFRQKFRRVDELLNQRQRTGGLAILQVSNRYIYYLVTKKYSFGKPTYATLFSSLKCLRDDVQEKGVKKIAIPRIGCGLDRLEWENVKFMIEFIFGNVDIEFVVCNLEPTEDSPQQKHKNCRLTHVLYPIEAIEAGTVVLYFSSEDEYVSDEMKNLDEKFHFLSEFRYARKSQGNVIMYTRNENYLVCGCIVKKRRTDSFDFSALQKCLQIIQKENRKYNFQFYAFQAFRETRDDCINYKIINILRNSLRGVDVYVCWPGDLQNEMAYKDRPESRDAKDDSWRNFSYRSRSPEEQNKSGNDCNWRHLNDSLGNSSSNTDAAEAEYDWYQEQYPKSNSQAGPQPSVQGQYPPDDSWEKDTATHNSSQTESAAQFHETVTYNFPTDEFESFKLDYENKSIDCSKLKESTLPKKYSLVCFARENMIIQSGVPDGKDCTPIIGKLLAQNQSEGGLAVVPDADNFWYFLISSAASSPTSETVFSAIHKLREHINKNRVKTIVIPMVENWGTNLKWSKVKSMFAFLLKSSQIEMVVVSIKPAYSDDSLMKQRKIKLTHVKSGIHQMKKKSVVIYLTSMDGYFTEIMNNLAKSITFKDNFTNADKTLGGVVKYTASEDCVLYGCVVRRQHSDGVNFEAFQHCLIKINRENQKDKFPYVRIQAMKDEGGSVSYKIITLLLHCLENVHLEMCWPGELKVLMPVHSG